MLRLLLRQILFIMFSMMAFSSHAENSRLAQLSVKMYKDKSNYINCGGSKKSFAACSIQISLNNPACLALPGSVTITNNSTIAALNIAASSNDANFNTFVVQNNACPSSLAPGTSCTITFYTNTSSTFTVNDVLVKGTNTSSTFVDINAIPCVLPTTLSIVTPTTIQIKQVNGATTPSFLTVANLGDEVALNVTATTPWTGVTLTPSANCAALAPDDVCSFDFTAPTPNYAGQITVSGTNTNAVISPYVAFRYANGLVYQIINYTAPAVAIVAETDASGGAPWALNNNNIPGSNDSNDGQGNSASITQDQGPGNYAAALCANFINPTQFWYLPAICQWRNITTGSLNDCNTANANIYDTLVQFGFLQSSFATDSYWSSTQVDATDAWYIDVNTFLPSQITKVQNFGVRCVRFPPAL